MIQSAEYQSRLDQLRSAYRANSVKPLDMMRGRILFPTCDEDLALRERVLSGESTLEAELKSP